MSEINILLVGNVPHELGSKNYGGVAKVVWNLADGLHNKSVKVCVAATGRYFKSFQEVKGIPIYGIGFSFYAIIKMISVLFKKLSEIRVSSVEHFLKLCYALYFLSYINRKVDFELIHVHHVINQIPLAAKLLDIKVPICATIHSYSEILNCEERIKRDKEKININTQLKYVDYVTHVSRQVQKQGKELGIKWNCNDRIIYNGINFEKVSNDSSIDCSDGRMCFVGSLSTLKGIQELLESVKGLSHRNISLVIIGSGELESLIRKEVKRNNINIKLLGILAHRQALEEMAKSCLLVVPSRSESFGLVYLEALSVGTPVIGYEPIIEEFKQQLSFDDKESDLIAGFDHQKHSIVELTHKIDMMVDRKNKSEYTNSLKKISEKVHNHFQWENITDQYISVYQRIFEQ